MLSIGLMNALYNFERMMDAIFGRLEFACVYLDEVMTFPKTLQWQFVHLKHVLQIVAGLGFKLDITKCHFAQPQNELSGHAVDESSVHVDIKKIQAFWGTSLPATVIQWSF